MIRCERCGGGGPVNYIEAHEEIAGDYRQWDLCESCYILWLQVMNAYLHTATVAITGDGTLALRNVRDAS